MSIPSTRDIYLRQVLREIGRDALVSWAIEADPTRRLLSRMDIWLKMGVPSNPENKFWAMFNSWAVKKVNFDPEKVRIEKNTAQVAAVTRILSRLVRMGVQPALVEEGIKEWEIERKKLWLVDDKSGMKRRGRPVKVVD